MTRWFDWMCLCRNIALSLVLTDFWVIGSWYRHLWELYWFLSILKIVYTRAYPTYRWLILEVFFIFKACLFWEDIFILGHSHLINFDIETRSSIYDFYFWWIIEIMIFLGSVFLAYLVWFGYPLTYVTHSYILHLASLYLHHLVRASHLLSPNISSSYMTLSYSLD